MIRRIEQLEREYARRLDDSTRRLRALTLLMISDAKTRVMAEALAVDHAEGRKISPKRLKVFTERLEMLQRQRPIVAVDEVPLNRSWRLTKRGRVVPGVRRRSAPR